MYLNGEKEKKKKSYIGRKLARNEQMVRRFMLLKHFGPRKLTCTRNEQMVRRFMLLKHSGPSGLSAPVPELFKCV